MMQRRKGADGERELVRLLRDHLGVEPVRNLNQSRDGGYDLFIMGIQDIALEVKRAAAPRLASWWAQAVEQAGDHIPVLAYRLDRQEWRFIMPLAGMGYGSDQALSYTVEMGIEGFALVARKRWLGPGKEGA